MRNFEHYYILKLRSKFHFMLIFIWKHQIQPSCDMTRKCLKNKANGSVKCTRARKKQLWKSTLESLKKMWRKNKIAAFGYFFLNQYGFDSKKKKKEQYNHAEKLKNQFWAWLVDIYDCQKQYRARGSLSIKMLCCFKSSKTSIHELRNSLDMHKHVLKFFFNAVHDKNWQLLSRNIFSIGDFETLL